MSHVFFLENSVLFLSQDTSLRLRVGSPRQVTHFQCRMVGYFTSPGIDTRRGIRLTIMSSLRLRLPGSNVRLSRRRPGFAPRTRNIIRCKNLALYIRDCVYLCLSDETLKAVGPFYLVSMPGEVKYPTSLHWKCVTCRGLHNTIL